MCLFQKETRTNSKYLSPYRRYHVGFRCGHCAECLTQIRLEYLMRAYFQAKDTVNQGYILFDTLTYDDEHINHISKFFPQILKYDEKGKVTNPEDDFTCFHYGDVRQFTNNLWTKISREFPEFDSKENMKFFLASEYGHEDAYYDCNGRLRKGTFRPHYHVLFYVKQSQASLLPPMTLINLIEDTWQYGMTDAWYQCYHKKGKGKLWCMQHNVIGKGYQRNTKKDMLSVSGYVSKYITKQADFMKEVESRIDKTVKRLIASEIDFTYDEINRYFRYQHEYFQNKYKNGDTDFSDYLPDNIVLTFDLNKRYYDLRERVVRYVSPFHRQSRGFGLCALSDEKVYKEIIELGKIMMPDRKKVEKPYNVPMYYMRKMFYKTVKDEEGKYFWVLNDLGKEQYPTIMQRRKDAVAERYFNWFQNCNGKVREAIIDCMQGRTWSDLADYVTYYRGRLIDESYFRVDEETGEVLTLPTIDEIIKYDINYNPLEHTETYNSDVSMVRLWHAPKYSFMEDEWFETEYRDFERNHIVNENTCYEFRYFDQIIDLYNSMENAKRNARQENFDEDARLKKLYRNLGIRTKNY